MSAVDPSSKAGELSAEQERLVRCHLEEVVASCAFAGSKRSQDFLQLIVEHALAGRFDSLRERMIGAEMFGRLIAYDTANDAVVRVKATEVRRKLAQFYREAVLPSPVRIEIPTGSYVPKFHWEPLTQPRAEASLPVSVEPLPSTEKFDEEQEEISHSTGRSFRRSPYLFVILLGISLLAAIGYWSFKIFSQRSNAKQEIHSMAILPLQNLSGDPKQDFFADGMTEELIADLGQIGPLCVISRTSVMT